MRRGDATRMSSSSTWSGRARCGWWPPVARRRAGEGEGNQHLRAALVKEVRDGGQIALHARHVVRRVFKAAPVVEYVRREVARDEVLAVGDVRREDGLRRRRGQRRSSQAAPRLQAGEGGLVQGRAFSSSSDRPVRLSLAAAAAHGARGRLRRSSARSRSTSRRGAILVLPPPVRAEAACSRGGTAGGDRSGNARRAGCGAGSVAACAELGGRRVHPTNTEWWR